jgi:VanZ family protein
VVNVDAEFEHETKMIFPSEAFLCQMQRQFANANGLFYCRAGEDSLSFVMPRLRAFLKYWLPVLFWMAVIFTASCDAKSFEHSSRLIAPLLHWLFPHMANKTVNLIVFLARKCAHLAEYAVFGLLVWRALNRSKNNLAPWSWPKVGGTLLIVFLYASSDEFHQRFVPTRTPRIHDVVIDTIGGAIGLFALWIFHRRKLKPQK